MNVLLLNASTTAATGRPPSMIRINTKEAGLVLLLLHTCTYVTSYGEWNDNGLNERKESFTENIFSRFP